MKLKDITGQKYSFLTVKKYVGNRKWLCVCDCGKEVVVAQNNLRSGHTRSCGCGLAKVSKIKNLEGKRFGRLKVIAFSHSQNAKTYWVCACDCGNVKTVCGRDLIGGHTTSCGCFQKETIRKISTTHGKNKTRLYSIWQDFLSRCYNPKVRNFSNYGGKGVTVCDEWRNDFQSFYDWAMANGYNPETKRGECTIDRIDVNGNYEPSNCRWATAKQQANNKTCNIRFVIDGEDLTLKQIAEKYEIAYANLYYRVARKGWNIYEAINTPIGNQGVKSI